MLWKEKPTYAMKNGNKEKRKKKNFVTGEG